MSPFWKKKKDDEDEYIPEDPFLPKYRNLPKDEESDDNIDEFLESEPGWSEVPDEVAAIDAELHAAEADGDNAADEADGDDAADEPDDSIVEAELATSSDADDAADSETEEADGERADPEGDAADSDPNIIDAEVLGDEPEEELKPLVEMPIPILEEKEEEPERELPEHGEDVDKIDDAEPVPDGAWLGAGEGIRGAEDLLPGIEKKPEPPKLKGAPQVPVVDQPWLVPTWILGAIAIVGAFMAAGSGTSSTVGWVMLLVSTLVAMAIIHTRPNLVLSPAIEAGVEERKAKAISGIHIALTIAYNAGLIALFGIAISLIKGTNKLDGLRDALPIIFAVNMALLLFAVTRQITVEGGVRSTWKTKAHGIFVLTIGVLAVAGSILVPVDLGGMALGELHVAFLTILFFLSVNSHGFSLTGLPTNFDLVMLMFAEPDDEDEDEEEVSRTPPFVYAMVAAISAMLLVFFAVSIFDLTSKFNFVADEGANYIILLFPIGLSAFFAYTGISMYRQSRQGLYKERLDPTQRNDIVVYGLSGMAGLLLSLLTLAVYQDFVRFTWDVPKNWILMDLLAATLIFTFGPIGIYTARKQRRVSAIEQRLPDFLNDLAETQRAGLTLPSALHSAANSDYGALSKEIRKMSHQVAWGVPFTDAVRLFAERTRSELVKRSVNLIVEASNSGGNTADILKAAAQDAFEIKGLEADRHVTLTTYLVVIYVTFFVFLLVIAVLTAQFLPQVIDAQTSINEQKGQSSGENGVGDGGVSAFAGSVGDLDLLAFKYYIAGLVQAVGNGLVGGALLAGRFTTGFRHVAGMVFAAWLVFRAIATFVI